MRSWIGIIVHLLFYSTTNTADVPAKANQLANFPLNFLCTGYYRYSDGKVYYRTTHGHWWSAAGSSVANANFLYTNASGVYPQGSNARGYALALRGGVSSTCINPSNL